MSHVTLGTNHYPDCNRKREIKEYNSPPKKARILSAGMALSGQLTDTAPA